MKYILLVWLVFGSIGLSAKEYNASYFGIRSDGRTDNTGSIQKAVDYIHSQRGGTLVFYVGRYLTGTIHLKSNVKIRLEEGAVLAGAQSPFDYNSDSEFRAILEADGQSNIQIYGKGVIEGAGRNLIEANKDLLAKGYIKDSVEPSLISFSNCKNVSVKGIHLWNGTHNALSASGCKNVNLEDLDINGRKIPTSRGIVMEGCKWVDMKNLFIEVVKEAWSSTDNEYVTIRDAIDDAGKAIDQI